MNNHRIILFEPQANQSIYNLAVKLKLLTKEDCFNFNCGEGLIEYYPFSKLQAIKSKYHFQNYSETIEHCILNDTRILSKTVLLSSLGLDLTGLANILQFLESSNTSDYRIIFFVPKEMFYRICSENKAELIELTTIDFKFREKSNFKIKNKK